MKTGWGLVVVVVLGGAVDAAEVRVRAPETRVVGYGVGKLEAALAGRGDTVRRVQEAGVVELDVVVEVGAIEGDGFRRERMRDGLRVVAGTERGALYGLLDLAEAVRLGASWDAIDGKDVKAAFEFRAIKFNLPWSAYRTSESIEQHRETCRDLKFWEAFLDMMAANRFNTLTLWSLHPFTYMVRPKNFPEACPFDDAELAQWQAFWRGLFAMARERGIETYLVNWNIFVSPEFSKAHNVAPWSVDMSHYGGETDASELVERYTREVVTQVVDEYPDLTGLGITLGERMGGMTPDERRGWLQRSFFDGISAAKRRVKFLYRAPLSANTGSGGTTSLENDQRSRAQVEELAERVEGPVYVEFKHNWSHAHSSPELFIVHGGELSDAYWNPAPTRHKVVWTMRNEDMFLLRWGQPDFVRAFVANQRKAYVGGAIIGSECYLPALDYMTAPGAHKSWQYGFERQWLFYATWGRLLYDPETPDSVFVALMEERFGKGAGADLLEAWKLASQVPLHFASFYRGEWDGSLYTEGFSTWTDRDNKPRRLIDVDSLIGHRVLDTKRYVNIAEYVKNKGKVEAGKWTPPALAVELDRIGGLAMERVKAVRGRGGVSPTLECELTDIEAWCAYAAYFAEKLRGGVALAEARAAGDVAKQREAVSALERALGHWERLAELGGKYNRLPVLSNSAGPFSWEGLTPQVRADIETARKPLVGGSGGGDGER